jgi:2-hydroxyacyl-CoA lyase 1
MAKLTGGAIMARALKDQGVQYMFGIVGFPVQPIAREAMKAGIKFYGCRNEQAASYAAGAVGYLTGRPGACLVVSGPGVVHGLSGLANAKENCWPMILIGGASDVRHNGMGGFQEERQVLISTPFCKFAHAVEHPFRIPFYVEMAVRHSIYGRPGATYLDMPDDIIQGEAEDENVHFPARCADPPRSTAPEENIQQALNVLKSAKRPLVIVGKGMAWSRAEDEVRAFIEKTGLPFLASPMGKGVMDDTHPLSVGAARTHALQEADVIFLMGARLNWILHFGLPPRYSKDVRIVQLDIAAEAISQNVPAEVALVGDGKAIVGQLNKALESFEYYYPEGTDWHKSIAEKSAANAKQVKPMIDDESAPTNYYRAFRDITPWIPENAIIVGEGANTMDIGRTQMPNRAPRTRLDAGSFGTMGVGMGLAMAAAAVHPDRPIISVSGDSAIGFSGMEMETVCRHKMNVKIVVLNNGGIGSGVAELPADLQKGAPNLLTVGCRYDKMMEAFGGKGFFVTDPKNLRAALNDAMKSPGPALVNVQLHHAAGRKPQQHRWHTAVE